MVYAITFFLLAAVATTVSIRAGWGAANPIAVFFFVWAPLVACVSLGVLDSAPLVARTWVVVLLASLSLVGGSLFAFWIAASAARRSPTSSEPAIDDARFDRVYAWALAALAGYVAVQIYEILPTLRAVGGLHAVFGGTSSGIEFRRDLQAQASDAAATQFSGGSALLGALGYVLFLGTISLFMGARYVRTGRIVRGLLPLILMAAYSVLTVQRFTFVYSLILFTFAYYYYAGSARRRERRASRRAWLAAGALVVLLPAIVYIPLKARQPGTTPAVAVQSVLSYYVDGLGSLNVREQGDPRAGTFPRGYGAWSFFGVASIASRVGAPVYLPPNTFPFVNPRTRGIGSSNVYTFLVYFLDDFGTAGVIVIPMLLGALTSLLHYQVRLRARASLIPAASILSTTVVMSFFGFSLIRDIRYPVLAVASIFVLRWASAARTGASSATVSPNAAVPRSAFLALSE